MSEFTSIISNFVAEVISAALTVASEGEGSEQQVAQQARRSASYKPNIRITGTIFALILRHAEFTQDLSPQDELPNNWQQEPTELDEDELDESEPWYGNDVDGGEFYDISPSPASTQDMYGHEDDSSTESELAAEIKRVFSPM